MTLINWIKENKAEFIIFLTILLVAAFLRFYKLDQYMTFLGDEGRDALMIKRILTTFDIPLIGPPTSIGNMYLGPLYYYMMSLPMAIFWLSPLAAAGMVALIGTTTVGLIYYLSRKWFGPVSAIIAALLYAISPVTIIYSRSSWNPNPTPFFALLTILGLYQLNQTKNFLWLGLIGASFAFALQMHYLALILLPIIGVLYFYELVKLIKEKKSIKHPVLGTILGILVFLTLMSPLVIFDLKHNFINYRAFTTFFFEDRTTTVNLNIFNTLDRIWPIYQHNFIERYLTGEDPWLIWITSVLILFPIIWVRTSWPLLALYVWLSLGVLGLALYKQSIYDHYLGFLNPAAFLLLGSVATSLPQDKTKRVVVSVFLLGLILLLVNANLQRSPLKSAPNNQLKRTQNISRFVIEEAKEKPFNFALIAKNNYDSAYQFYLEIYKSKPEQVPFNITDQLFVVCEDPQCSPINHPKYEIAAFGWAKVENVKDFSGVKVFKLVHNVSSRP